MHIACMELGHEEQSSSSSSSELSSDEELQAEFAKGRLKPGLLTRAAPPKTYTNNVSGLREQLALLRRKELDWLERMDVVVSPSASGSGTVEGKEGEETVDPDDDFGREMHFYRQAQWAASVGLRKLEELGIPTQRPDDYFAEMVKTDDHMRKVRESLLSRQKGLEQKEKARKLRELKKYGKKVQQEILQKRREEKKAAIEAVKKFRKGKGEKPAFLQREDDDFPIMAEKEGKPATKGRFERPMSKKRQMKNTKFGFGGKKRWMKSNTANSSADMSSFSSAKHSKPKKPTAGKKAKRLGKARRQKMRSRVKR